jgi:hypothetical protein
MQNVKLKMQNWITLIKEGKNMVALSYTHY